MINKISKYTTRAVGIAAIVEVLSVSPAASGDWATFKAAYCPKYEHAMLVLEGKHFATPQLSVYGFLEATGTTERPTDFEDFYGEVRLNQSLGSLDAHLKRIGIAGEGNGGTDMADFIRFGLTYTPPTPQGNYTFIKWYPIETDGERGSQVSIFTEQSISSKFKGSLLVDYNVRPAKSYVEMAVNLLLNDKMSFRLEGRGAQELEKISDIAQLQVAPYVMIAYGL